LKTLSGLSLVESFIDMFNVECVGRVDVNFHNKVEKAVRKDNLLDLLQVYNNLCKLYIGKR